MVSTQLRRAEDLLQMERDSSFELVEGELHEVMSPRPSHAKVVGILAMLLGIHIRREKLGDLFVGDPMVLLQRDPDTVLAPDIAFVSAERLPLEDSAFMTIPPDIAIEVVSPGNSPGEIERKVALFLRGGVRSVWVVYPRQRQIVIHAPEIAPRVFGEGEVVTDPDTLPGFSFSLSDVFED
ncbi:MAG: Uma2 family endonuclease [Thermomicrobiales bacterium]|nr:Uma2 family endonuclease [Thermomicrobiales bacterium]